MTHPDDSTQEAELLVAYLDGELDREDALRVERRLAMDPDLRHQLLDFQRAWDLLDELPLGEVDDKFAPTTVEMVAVQAESESQADELRLHRRRNLVWAAASVMALAAAGVGYAWTSYTLDAENRSLLAVLPLAQNLEAYQWADSIDFLRSLQQDQAFASFSASRPGAPSEPATQTEDVQSMSLTQRRDYLATLGESARESLHRQVKEFARLSEERQHDVRELHEQLHQDPDAAQLMTTLRRYNGWLASLPGERRANLLSLSEAERLKEIQKMIAEDERRRIDRQDGDAVRQWVYAFVEANEEKLLALAPDYMRAGLKGSGPESKRRGLTRILMNPAGMDIVDQNDLAPLLEQLSPIARQHLEQLSLERQRQQIREWFFASLFMRYRRSDQSLLDGPRNRGRRGRPGEGFSPPK